MLFCAVLLVLFVLCCKLVAQYKSSCKGTHYVKKMKCGDEWEYTGPLRDGKKEGRGVEEKGTYCYVGHFVNNVRHGKGVLLSDSNLVYGGEWKDGKYDGSGFNKDDNGSFYFGGFEKDERNGEECTMMLHGMKKNHGKAYHPERGIFTAENFYGERAKGWLYMPDRDPVEKVWSVAIFQNSHRTKSRNTHRASSTNRTRDHSTNHSHSRHNSVNDDNGRKHRTKSRDTHRASSTNRTRDHSTNHRKAAQHFAWPVKLCRSIMTADVVDFLGRLVRNVYDRLPVLCKPRGDAGGPLKLLRDLCCLDVVPMRSSPCPDSRIVVGQPITGKFPRIPPSHRHHDNSSKKKKGKEIL
eukprot:gene56-35_t